MYAEAKSTPRTTYLPQYGFRSLSVPADNMLSYRTEHMMQRKRPRPAAFKVGDKVRVKHGVRDVDYPDIPLGGWAGTIAKVHQNGMYDVQWSEETLNNIPPVVKKRCEKDGLVLEEYGLAEDDLEPDDGGPLNIEQPTMVSTVPLSPKDQDDRIRMVFGLTSNDPLPEVNDETLRVYQNHLAAKLTFPFDAAYQPEHSKPQNVKVIGLGDPKEPMIDEMVGILCEVEMDGQTVAVPMGELEVAKGKPNRRFIKDYCSWFWNFR